MKYSSKGQVTIFFSLIILLIFSLIFTLLESARASALSFRLQLAANAGVSSAFAMYDSLLWEKYGLLFFTDSYGGGSEMEEIICSYAEANGAYCGTGKDFIAFSDISMQSAEYVFATDDAGEIFAEAVITYMKECGLVTELEDLISDYAEAESQLNASDLLNEDGEIDMDSIGELLTKTLEESEGDEEEPAASEPDTSESRSKAGGSEAESSSEKQNSDNGSRAENLDEAAQSEAFQNEASQDEEAQIAEAEKIAADYDIDLAEASSSFSDLVSSFRNWEAKGFLSLVCDDVDEISEELICKTGLPSELDDNVKNQASGASISHSVIDNGIFREYFVTKFSSYTDSHSGPLQLEYLISGKDSDLANLSSVVKKLIAVRSALNLIFIESHSDYKAEATALGTIIATCFENPEAGDTIGDVIAIIWAIVEGVEDVKALLDGDKVALIKNTGDWKTKLLSDNSGGSSGHLNMDYSGYLRFLLYLRSNETIAYRAMDMIQLDIQEEEPAFKMENCIYAMRGSILGSGDGLFPFLPEELSYSMTAKVSFGYGEISYGQ